MYFALLQKYILNPDDANRMCWCHWPTPLTKIWEGCASCISIPSSRPTAINPNVHKFYFPRSSRNPNLDVGAIKRIQNRTASKPLRRTRCKLWIYRYTHPNTPRLRVTDQKKKEYKYKYSGSNKVLPKIERDYFSAIFGRKIHLKTVLRPCWPLEWCRKNSITSVCLKRKLLQQFHSNWTME